MSMKLASMQQQQQQRPHAPPVPPRPSKQVVVEALKRSSTRLPCPTRQAPPPPTNVRPWRQLDYPSSNNRFKPVEKSHDVNPVKDTHQKKLPGFNNNDNNNCNNIDINDNNTISSDNNSNENESSKKLIKNKISKSNDVYENNFDVINQEPNLVDNQNNSVNNYENIVISNNQERKLPPTTNQCIILPAVINKLENNNLSTELSVGENTREIISKEIHNKLITSPDSPMKSITAPTTTIVITESDNKLQVLKKQNSVENLLASSVSNASSDDCATIVVVEKPNEDKISISSEEDKKNNIHHQDWLESGIRYSSTKITIPAGDKLLNDGVLNSTTHHFLYNYSKTRPGNNVTSLYDKIAMSSLQGLPPLPRSLSGLYLNEEFRETNEPPPPPMRSSSKTPKVGKTIQSSNSRPSLSPGRQLTTLDSQLAILRKEMFGLRQLDLSLLSQLWSLNESIQEFRQLVQDHDDRAPSPSPSSEEGDDGYGNHPPAPPRRPASLHHHHHHYSSSPHHHHHHRPPRPPRPLRPLGSDESPSSEEYGAV
ncbi:putative uncharacterized protein DDB_G0286901 [Cotesia glomerata]|uniref:Uncharacterized protein n=1 Tax=Cotesia glomerata TaxID=32391 RepID=A0AAV7J784_COTGL|nr:putative uncharacterized protein DDB_G0286901 [Cotesia glomerata]XP_044592008.1 putative uncharacterized protein DDB_G0286901 [Cotesia glomerata]XP_044592012.1 putative uncharacterized protein DDB_G0286901 [Cotesia glomerata]KAH0567553.1 hypothetical protein KQX54_010692 [Cotesia glomerata]